MKKKVYISNFSNNSNLKRKVAVVAGDIEELPDLIGETLNEVHTYNIIHEGGKVAVWGEYVYEENQNNN